jgi:putative IMPACT (imprinted ancient) family translation regulator
VAVSATTVASISLTFVSDGSGITLGSSGTSAVTIAFGSVQAYGGTVPSGVTKTVNGTTNWSLSTPVDVVVQVANQTSSNYTLTAGLQNADSTNTWQLNTTSLTTTPATLTSTGTYGTTAYTYKLTIPFSATAGAITNTINFTATAN